MRYVGMKEAAKLYAALYGRDALMDILSEHRADSPTNGRVSGASGCSGTRSGPNNRAALTAKPRIQARVAGLNKAVPGVTMEKVVAILDQKRPDFIRVVKSVDKEALLAARSLMKPEDLAVLGLRVIQSEEFFVDPKKDLVGKGA